MTFVVCGIMMGLYELIYVYQNNPEMKADKKLNRLSVG